MDPIDFSERTKQAIKSAAVTVGSTLIGRKRLIRAASILLRGARLEEDMMYPEKNGEYKLLKAYVDYARTQGFAPVFFDVGANVGDWTLMAQEFASNVGLQTQGLHLFEPTPGTHKILLERLSAARLFDGVHVNQTALSDEVAEKTFYSCGTGNGTNSFHPVRGNLVQKEEVLKTDTVERYCASHAIEHIHFMKIDTEGHDIDVLKGTLLMA